MDARDALRRYLEQRRDMGERELVLDSMTVDEALALIGAPAARAATVAPLADRPPSVRERGASADAPASADWREAIRAAGGAPDRAPTPVAPPVERAAEATSRPKPATQPGGAPTTVASERSTTVPDRVSESQPPASIPTGLVVGGGNGAGRGHDDFAELTSLAEVAAVVAACKRCPLYATAINPVPGEGNPNADFMIVGEAPGASEDEQGKPFVGRAGQLLTKIIEAINLTREDVFIANVLKHRPPGNRNPLPEEVRACSPYLVRQIELVRPKVLLALGTFAAQTLLETKVTVGKLRGQEHRFHGVPLIVTYHPAALLRNPEWKRPTWEDVKLARRILDRALAGA